MTTDQKIHLAHILGKTIKKMENTKKKYNWFNPVKCNCGMLAQEALGMNPLRLSLELYFGVKKNEASDRTWTDMSKQQAYCEVTGEKMSRVFRKLFELGLTKNDIKHLENTSDPRVLMKMNIRSGNNTNREFVISYMKTWKELLETEVVCPTNN